MRISDWSSDVCSSDLHTKAAPWVSAYRWPILFFVAVGFWNLVGAGVFGFMINPPISLYYIQGLNTTAVHAHSALFGVYGLLGIGLLLFLIGRASCRDRVDQYVENSVVAVALKK